LAHLRPRPWLVLSPQKQHLKRWNDDQYDYKPDQHAADDNGGEWALNIYFPTDSISVTVFGC
jgi:hypothetical protein